MLPNFQIFHKKNLKIEQFSYRKSKVSADLSLGGGGGSEKNRLARFVIPKKISFKKNLV